MIQPGERVWCSVNDWGDERQEELSPEGDKMQVEGPADCGVKTYAVFDAWRDRRTGAAQVQKWMSIPWINRYLEGWWF